MKIFDSSNNLIGTAQKGFMGGYNCLNAKGEKVGKITVGIAGRCFVTVYDKRDNQIAQFEGGKIESGIKVLYPTFKRIEG